MACTFGVGDRRLAIHPRPWAGRGSLARSLLLLLWALPLPLVISAADARAETVVIIGADGTPGAGGTAGDPGTAGGDGGDGESASALADAANEDNRADATGGNGAPGGTGGDGVPAGADGGAGGNGGNGGAANAEARGDGTPLVTATATGGDASFGGSGGGATGGGVPGASGPSGAGGAAAALATSTGSGAVDLVATSVGGWGIGDSAAGSARSEADGASTSGSISANADAAGGANGRSGGDATAVATARNNGGGAESTATARTGRESLGATADASAASEGAGNDDVLASATAQGFSAGANSRTSARATNTGTGRAIADALAISPTVGAGFNGGDAAASAFASNAGAGDVVATARANGGESVDGTSPGSASVVAEGHSTGGGDVTVRALKSTGSADGGQISLENAVSGSTSGPLELLQFLGPTGLSRPAEAGDAYVTLEATNPGGGSLALDVTSFGGTGTLEQDAGDAIVGDVIGGSTHGAAVDVSVSATGGLGGNGRDGGTVLQENRSGSIVAGPSRIHGESNGGPVRVEATFRGGDGGVSFLDSPGGAGGSIDMENAATAETRGNLALIQHARGGESGIGIRTGQSGPAGSARSVLRNEAAVAGLDLHATAIAGHSYAGVPGSDAVAISDAVNTAGGAIASSLSGGGASDAFERAGDALLEASARTLGDGNDVVVGLEDPGNQRLIGAFGGRPDALRRLSPNAEELVFGDGGSAASRSMGTAEGDAVVAVYDRALGGDGGGFRPIGPPGTVAGTSGAGGMASSEALASGGGASLVTALAEAEGGDAGVGTTLFRLGGDAAATADATGLGQVEARALARGGDSDGRAGSGLARAGAQGANGFARAEAETGASLGARLRATSHAAVGSRRDVSAQATFATALADAPLEPALEGTAFVTGDPLAADVQRALDDNSALADLFADPGTEMLALARWRGEGAGQGALELLTGLDIVLGETDPADQLALAGFDLLSLGDAFSALVFGVAKNGVQLGDTVRFDTAEAAVAFFEDRVIDLGSGWAEGDELSAVFELTVGGETSFDMSVAFAQVVPEPGTAWLLGGGLFVLALRRQRR